MTDEREWPQPPIWFEGLPTVLELLSSEAEERLRGWVLVPQTWLSPTCRRQTISSGARGLRGAQRARPFDTEGVSRVRPNAAMKLPLLGRPTGNDSRSEGK